MTNGHDLGAILAVSKEFGRHWGLSWWSIDDG